MSEEIQLSRTTLLMIDSVMVDVVVAVATHPTQNMIASASMESDLSVRIWVDRGPPAES